MHQFSSKQNFVDTAKRVVNHWWKFAKLLMIKGSKLIWSGVVCWEIFGNFINIVKSHAI